MAKRRGSGEGSIYRAKDGRWRGEISLGYKSDGKPKRRILYGKTRVEVSQAMTRVLREVQVGLDVSPGKQTVGGHLRYWLDDVAKNQISPQTYRSYEWILRVHLLPEFGRLQLDKLTPSRLQKFLNRKHESGLRAATIRHIAATLRAALSCAQDSQLIYINVAKMVSLPRGPKYRPTVLKPEDAQRLLAATADHRYGALFHTCLCLGLRRGEVLGLKWCDIDLDHRQLRVERAIGRVKGLGLVFGETKSVTSKRSLSLPKVCVEVLKKQRSTQAKQRQWASDDWEETNLVFTNGHGGPIAPEVVSKEFSAALGAAGMPAMRFHDLRHSCATILLSQGVSMKAIQATLGHASYQLTADTYAHMLPELRKEVATKMDRALSGSHQISHQTQKRNRPK